MSRKNRPDPVPLLRWILANVLCVLIGGAILFNVYVDMRYGEHRGFIHNRAMARLAGLGVALILAVGWNLREWWRARKRQRIAALYTKK